MNSIKQHITINPISVREIKDQEINKQPSKTKYMIVDGHGRYQVALDIGLTEILCYVID